MSSKAMSPLVATVLLVVFALIIGTATMNWGKSYVDRLNLEEQSQSAEGFRGTYIVQVDQLDTQLKKLQLQHITGTLSEQEYLEEEKKLLNR